MDVGADDIGQETLFQRGLGSDKAKGTGAVTDVEDDPGVDVSPETTETTDAGVPATTEKEERR